jgi:ubiquinone/menaquinone biosynthesis C-methylase UbiE
MAQDFFWDQANTTRMGCYLTRVEGRFITEGLARSHWVKTILDIGGGSGRFAIPLYQQGYRVIVADSDTVPLHVLSRRQPGVDRILTYGGAQKLAIADASVDCILCIEVFSLSDRADWFFPECYRVLRPNGLLMFTAHNSFSYKGALKRLIEANPDFYTASIGSIRARARMAGFTMLREYGFNWAPATRLSESRLIACVEYVERGWHTMIAGPARLSPWVLIQAQK